MSTKTFKKQDIKDAVREDTDENSPLVLEHAGMWEAGGKHQNQENILRETATGDFYCYNHSRTGSPYSDYCYGFEWENDEIELVKVVKRTKVIEVWAAVDSS